jgi:hypothetical protein
VSWVSGFLINAKRLALKDTCMYACTCTFRYGWMDGWMDGRMDGWMDGWTDEYLTGWVGG